MKTFIMFLMSNNQSVEIMEMAVTKEHIKLLIIFYFFFFLFFFLITYLHIYCINSVESKYDLFFRYQTLFRFFSHACHLPHYLPCSGLFELEQQSCTVMF